MKCSTCNSSLNNGDLFCGECGTKIGNRTEPMPVATAVPTRTMKQPPPMPRQPMSQQAPQKFVSAPANSRPSRSSGTKALVICLVTILVIGQGALIGYLVWQNQNQPDVADVDESSAEENSLANEVDSPFANNTNSSNEDTFIQQDDNNQHENIDESILAKNLESESNQFAEDTKTIANTEFRSTENNFQSEATGGNRSNESIVDEKNRIAKGTITSGEKSDEYAVPESGNTITQIARTQLRTYTNKGYEQTTVVFYWTPWDSKSVNQLRAFASYAGSNPNMNTISVAMHRSQQDVQKALSSAKASFDTNLLIPEDEPATDFPLFEIYSVSGTLKKKFAVLGDVKDYLNPQTSKFNMELGASLGEETKSVGSKSKSIESPKTQSSKAYGGPTLANNDSYLKNIGSNSSSEKAKSRGKYENDVFADSPATLVGKPKAKVAAGSSELVREYRKKLLGRWCATGGLKGYTIWIRFMEKDEFEIAIHKGSDKPLCELTGSWKIVSARTGGFRLGIELAYGGPQKEINVYVSEKNGKPGFEFDASCFPEAEYADRFNRLVESIQFVRIRR